MCGRECDPHLECGDLSPLLHSGDKSPHSKVLRVLATLTVAAAIYCFLYAAQTNAQSQPGLIKGVVQDQTGAPIPRVKVLLRSAENSVLGEATSDSDGEFLIAATPSAEMIIIASAPGFALFEKNLAAIQSNQSDITVVLSPASLSEQVTITANRTETRLGDVAASIATLTSQDLTITSAITLDDTLRQIPGFSLFRRSGSRTANPTSQGVSLRGVGASGASRAVVLENGVPLNDPFGGWVYWSRVPRASVESIEVLRGGASHLYGSAALGGVINVLTRRPDDSVLDIEGSYGNQRTSDASVFAGGRRRQWGARLSAQTFRTDGYVIVDERDRGGIDIPANSRSAVANLTIERSFSDSAKAFASASFFGESRSNGTPLQTNRTHIRRFALGVDFGSAQTGTFKFRAYGGTQIFDQNFSVVNADRSAEALTRLQRVPAQSTGVSVQWSRALDQRHVMVAGIEAHEVRGASDEIAFAAGRPTALIGAGGRERAVGLFFADIIRVKSNLFVTVGARLDRWRNYDAFSTTRPLASAAATTAIAFPDRIESAFSPHLSLLFKPTNNFGLYVSGSRAFRAPTLNELYRSFRVGDVLTLANEDLFAERLTGGEAGASFSSLGQKLNVRGTAFWSEITRPIANVTLAVQPALITRQRQNLGRTRSRGLELEWDLGVADRWSVSGGYLFADATVLRFPVNTTLEGLLIPQVPRHQFTVQLRYANPSLVILGVQARGSSEQFDDDQNRFRLDKYFTLDALVSRRITRRVDAFMAGENLFDQRYEIGLTPVRTVGPPRLMRLGFRLRLGSQR